VQDVHKCADRSSPRTTCVPKWSPSQRPVLACGSGRRDRAATEFWLLATTARRGARRLRRGRSKAGKTGPPSTPPTTVRQPTPSLRTARPLPPPHAQTATNDRQQQHNNPPDRYPQQQQKNNSSHHHQHHTHPPTQLLSRPVEDCDGSPGLAGIRHLGLDDPSASRPDLHCNFGGRSIRVCRASRYVAHVRQPVRASQR
jgi:hypothetical protein